MLLEKIFKNYSSRIRRKAYNIDSPVQAQRSSGLWMPHPPHRTPVGVQPTTGLIGWVVYSYPELRFACTGLPICKTYGLLFENKKEQR